ncbi:nuclear transport factor 2 family protein [Amycolatopsis sp. PS_44_ISF1]|uniref:nuclear transport factor 2 family protein n=1 Tax=Amycolatopsis sp. PS_44_ISF1 TaxID=2974917 RepID=UPI0028DD4572|nr:nuclear transport factor 2 family protein [Amycolatopsis sp. PS_44_ISF1]MDT8913485.1 nuclear transport factor 2 family protein [Amycolatopsis sp. PS_44_ISF1]
MASRFEHVFAGDHALGGSRHTVAGLRSWFERLYRLAPDLAFTVKHIAVSGPPWNTTAVIEWRDEATLAAGGDYANDGVHVVRMRWGKAISLHAYLDTAVFADSCRRMAQAGITEAGAAPIQD